MLTLKTNKGGAQSGRPSGLSSMQPLAIRRSPRDAAGRIIKRGPCDVCGYGNLQYEGDGFWLCDGLAEPKREGDALIECPRYHQDGEAPYSDQAQGSAVAG